MPDFAGCDGGEGWIRTSVRLRGQIYSLLPLTTRPPLHGGQRGQWLEQVALSTGTGGDVVIVEPQIQGVAARPSYAGRAVTICPPDWTKVAPAVLGAPPSSVPRTDYGGAGEGNRTLVVSLEGFCSTIELHPQPAGKRRLDHSSTGVPTRIVGTFQHRSARSGDLAAVGGVGKRVRVDAVGGWSVRIGDGRRARPLAPPLKPDHRTTALGGSGEIVPLAE